MSVSKKGSRIGHEEEKVTRSNIHSKMTTHACTHTHTQNIHKGLMNSDYRFWDLVIR